MLSILALSAFAGNAKMHYQLSGGVEKEEERGEGMKQIHPLLSYH